MNVIDSDNSVVFSMGDLYFEYDENKNEINIDKHGISFINAARIFFDFDRIEMYDDSNSINETRYQTIGNMMSVMPQDIEVRFDRNKLIFVVYTERRRYTEDGKQIETIRLISARFATLFEKGLYYGKY